MSFLLTPKSARIMTPSTTHRETIPLGFGFSLQQEKPMNIFQNLPIVSGLAVPA